MCHSKKNRKRYDGQVLEILSKMTLQQKISLLIGGITEEAFIEDELSAESHYNYVPINAGGIPELKIPALKFCDGTRGVVCGIGKSTCFPVSICRAASFDTELEEEIGRAIGKEVRAYGGNLFGGICLNLAYHPGWGRCQETFGEDSFVIGQFGKALVKGVQSEHVIACLKHFAFNSSETNRLKVNIQCDPRVEREVYLPHFKECVDAGAACIMTAYNKYNSVYCGQNAYLLQEVLKKEWEFDGVVMCDFISGIHSAKESINSGMDLEMCGGRYYGRELLNLVKQQEVAEETVNEAARRILRVVLEFEDTYQAAKSHYGMDIVGCEEHRKLALKSAREGITLLKNQGVLPFDSKKIHRIAVMGRLAKKENTGALDSSRVYPEYVVTPYQGICDYLPNAEVAYYSGKDKEHAKQLAEKSDAVVLVVGYDYRDEGEYTEIENHFQQGGGDRKTDLGLHREDVELILKCGTVNQSTVVVLIGGSMIMMSEWIEAAPSVLMAYYPGQEGGRAIAEIIFGRVNPGGKLPFVVPVDEKILPHMLWDANEQIYGYYHGYALLDKRKSTPLFPFGYGLSYTSFEIKCQCFQVRHKSIQASCMIKNVGEYAGAEVVQVYIGFAESAFDRPVKVLCGFQRVSLRPGQEKKVHIMCPLERIRYYNTETEKYELECMEYEVYIGTSSDTRDLYMEKIDLKVREEM